MRAPWIPRASQIAALLVVGLLAGCGDDNPTKPGGGGPPVYPTLNSPQNVLSALITAYASRDSVEYRKLYAFDYKGTSKDLRFGTSVTLFNADEADHIQALARANTITKVDFTMGTPSSWIRLASDDVGHPEWAVIQISGSQFRLQIDDTNMGALIVNSFASFHTFRFQPTPPDSTSTDTLWTIVQWDEVQP